MKSEAQDMRDEFAHVVRDMIRPLSIGFGLFIGYTAIREFVELTGRERILVGGADLVVAVYLLTLAGFMWFKPPPLRSMNAWGASIAWVLAATDMITVAVRETVPNFPATALVLAGIGAVVLSWRWLIITQVSVWVAWLIMTQSFAANPNNAIFALQISSITGLAIHWGRFKAYTQLIGAREREAEARQGLEDLNAELDRFAGVAAHDLQNPLTAFKLKVAALKARNTDPSVQEAAAALDRMANSMQGLIEDLLAYAQAGAGAEFGHEATLVDVVAEVQDLFADEIANMQGVIEVHELPHYEGDYTMLRQLVQNLVGNAIAYRGDAPPHVVLRGHSDAAMVSFSVEDAGVGFSPEVAEDMFKPFQRGDSHVPGHGLGLATCARVTKHLGGKITAESTPGKGSVFTVELPIRVDDPAVEAVKEGKGEEETVQG